MEINKILTISTAHVCDATMDALEEESEKNRWPFLTVYLKEEYGYFVYINQAELNNALNNNTANFPEDLLAAIELALNHECDILCLDCDGKEVEELENYWDDDKF